LGMKRTSLIYRMKKLRISRPGGLEEKYNVCSAAGGD
jgi:hypothetical protein